jgi:hypothetical protein
MADELDSDFSEQERIFHYTTPEGLYGILESNCIWATHFQFLNDSKEFYAARESLVQFVHKAIHRRFAAWKVNKQFEFEHGVDLSGLALHEAGVIVDAMYTTTYEKLGSSFVFSGFCCNPDHKSYRNGGLLHWATYGRHGGYALRLNPHKIAPLLKTENTKFPDFMYRSGRVVYSEDAPESRFKRDYETLATVAQSMIEGMAKDDFSNVDIAKSADPFWRISSMLKDEYFRDEAEARIVGLLMNAGRPGNRQHTIHVRHRDGVSIPYIKLFEHSLLDENCPIETIIIGPHPERVRRYRALATFLRHAKLSFIEVVESDVPYIA